MPSEAASCSAGSPARSRCASAIAAAGLALLLLAGTARAQISPGPLSKAHQFLTGPTKCASCHQLAAGRRTFKCLECHTDIFRRLAQQRGLHPTLVNKGSTGQDCGHCHSDHNGEEFPLIRWDPSPESFDHSKTGYALEGKHAGLACNRCHTPEHISEAERRSIVLKDLKRTYLGLSRDCLSCHKDEHRGQLATDCLSCHTFAEWKKVARFDHAKTRYPLTGAHVQVACQKCHPAMAEPERLVKYVGLNFDQCISCHNDPHRGVFPNSCESCHTTGGWKQLLPGAKFDHSKTKYPLLAKHAMVRCAQCHVGADFKRPVPFEKCVDCHKPDPHGGQFRQRADGGECTACHTVEGFKPARFGVPEHAATKYPLEGGHAKVACAKCHLPAGRATQYKVRFALCTDCHADPHKGQFAGPPHVNRCESCHTVQVFQPSTFTLAQHQKTRFPLGGGHVAVACVDCHRSDPRRRPAPPVPYRFEDRSCAVCHTDPHRGQFRERMVKPRPDGSAPGCEACHTAKSWRELFRFDHSTTSFPLTGAHRAVPCADCHKPPRREKTLKNVDFRSAPSRCKSCHEDIHGGQFSTQGFTLKVHPEGKPPHCAECHNSIKWKPSTFDHDRRTSFPLLGAHERVPCAECHKTTRLVRGRTVLFYKPTPKECAACHGPA